MYVVNSLLKKKAEMDKLIVITASIEKKTNCGVHVLMCYCESLICGRQWFVNVTRQVCTLSHTWRSAIFFSFSYICFSA